MLFYSTNRNCPPVGFRQAVMQGLAGDGGLFMPESIPQMPSGWSGAISNLSFAEMSFDVAAPFLAPDVPGDVLRRIIQETVSFDAPLVRLDERLYVLELFHGLTLAFKDFGARFMAQLMSYFQETETSDLVVLVATSGDTGSAVAHGFYQAPGIRVVLLYPSGRVSEIQEKQLTTLGGNITALEVEGTFDDCQSLVKEAFIDPELKRRVRLTSANSINIARLIPQCFYYVRALAQIPRGSGDVIIAVPSGNFGNLTAGLIVKKMGLPVNRFVAATNVNDVVPHYLATGRFQPQPSLATLSSAMDVGNPSNFTRILALYDNDYSGICRDVSGAAFNDAQTKAAIAELYSVYGYVSEPHGAVGYLGLKQAFSRNASYFRGNENPCSEALNSELHLPGSTGIFLETAHPAKFQDIVQHVLGKEIEIPGRLQSCLRRQKNSIKMPFRFDALKAFLLG